jgi:hypothetical protein
MPHVDAGDLAAAALTGDRQGSSTAREQVPGATDVSGLATEIVDAFSGFRRRPPLFSDVNGQVDKHRQD